MSELEPLEGEPVVGQPCPVCGLPDPEHDWDVHDERARIPEVGSRLAPALAGAALPNMLKRSSTRGGDDVRVLALHTTEGILDAADLRAWSSWSGSSHASADAAGKLLTPADGFVPYHLASWTLRSGNPWSENIELCGFAKWTLAQWTARELLLEGAARWLADRSRARSIPLVKLTAAQYRAGARGVIDHNDHTVGYRDGTHWDVGAGFPWQRVLGRAREIAGALPATPTPPREAATVRYVNLDNPDGSTPDRVALLTVDPVARSTVLPGPAAAAWVQWQAFIPPGAQLVNGKPPRLEWLVVTNVDGKHDPLPQADLPHRASGSAKLRVGANGVEVRVLGIPRGASVAVHVDAVGHA